MTRVVWKESLRSTRGTVQTINMPAPFQVLDMRPSYSGFEQTIDMWFLCDPDSKRETATFHIVPTGGGVPPDALHVGTVHHESLGAPLVFHVFRAVSS